MVQLHKKFASKNGTALKSVSISVLFYHFFFTEVHLKKFRDGWQKKRKMMRFFNGNLIQRLPPHRGRDAHEISCFFNQENPRVDIDITDIAGFYTIIRICNHTAE